VATVITMLETSMLGTASLVANPYPPPTRTMTRGSPPEST